MTKKIFKDYELKEKIATGTFMEIFKVEKEERLFALKKLKPHLQYDRFQIEKLKTEAKLLQTMNDKEHFPALVEQGIEGDEYYLIQELIEGLTLKEILQKISPTDDFLTVPWVCFIVLGVCRGLEKLHRIEREAGGPTLHGDIKPLNVMVGVKGEIKILDLALVGETAMYSPLERKEKEVMGIFSDLYPTGHLFFELLQRRPLFLSKKKKDYDEEMKNTAITEEIFEPSLPQEVKKILVRSLNQDPKVRYQSVSEFRKDLEDYLAGGNFKLDPRELGEWVRKMKEGGMEGR